MRKKVKLPFAFPKKSTVEQKDTAVESVPAEIGNFRVSTALMSSRMARIVR